MHPGKTRNPWNASHTPGGSSQGSAAAVAAGHVPAALGTQTNGSVIRPAAYCGVIGFKPSLHAVPFAGVNLFSETLDTLGTFTRSVADAARLAAALADPGAIPATVAALPRPPRIAFLPAFPWTDVQRDMREALDAAATRLREAGAEIVPVALPDVLAQAAAVHRTIMLHEAVRNLAPVRARAEAKLSSTLRDALDDGARIPADVAARAPVARLAMIAAAADWLGRYDALLVPSAPAGAPAGLAKTGDPSCCTLASLLGAPAITLPVALDANGLPLGAQLVAPAGHDAALLGVAAWCEARLPFTGLL
jgi:Asp-tRNA(Asn)/Glu-tRNA(Gln) amidotransferase A subunit family amidase